MQISSSKCLSMSLPGLVLVKALVWKHGEVCICAHGVNRRQWQHSHNVLGGGGFVHKHMMRGNKAGE